jgi:hypothetical protein
MPENAHWQMQAKWTRIAAPRQAPLPHKNIYHPSPWRFQQTQTSDGVMANGWIPAARAIEQAHSVEPAITRGHGSAPGIYS